MKPLTQREAERCEMAKEPVCKCRCGGAAHGKGRVADGGDFSLLPRDDPHYRPPITKAQAHRMLNHAYSHVVGTMCPWDGGDLAWNAWREAQTIITDAKRGLKQQAMAPAARRKTRQELGAEREGEWQERVAGPALGMGEDDDKN